MGKTVKQINYTKLRTRIEKKLNRLIIPCLQRKVQKIWYSNITQNQMLYIYFFSFCGAGGAAKKVNVGGRGPAFLKVTSSVLS